MSWAYIFFEHVLSHEWRKQWEHDTGQRGIQLSADMDPFIFESLYVGVKVHPMHLGVHKTVCMWDTSIQ